jgi:hypothetical protein
VPTWLADNQLAITGSGWDPELLRLELGELKLDGFDLSLTGFGDLELKDLLADRTEGLTDPDDAPAVPEHPVSQTGDLWLLGRHRLLCGDSTVAADVAITGITLLLRLAALGLSRRDRLAVILQDRLEMATLHKASFLRPEILIGEERDCRHLDHDLRGGSPGGRRFGGMRYTKR